MRIAMVSEHASPLATLGGVDAGGQNVHVAALATALGALGHTVTVATRRDDPRLPRFVDLAPGVVVEHVDAGPARPVPKDEMFPHMATMAAALRASWTRTPPAVVHSHFWMSGWAAARALDGLGVPLVHTFHALGSVKRRHQGAADPSPGRRLLVERDLARTTHVVATSTEEIVDLVRMGADPADATLVPCGVDAAHFRPDPRRARTGAPTVLTVSRLVERKGIAEVIRALRAVPDARLVVAGGPEAAGLDHDPEARRLQRLARIVGVDARVTFLGRVERADLPARYRDADVVACTPWYEPFGMVALEAMACGVPVVASAVGGLRDTVVDHVTGRLVPPRDPDALGGALAALLADPDTARRLGAAGARRARARYDWPTVARDTLGAYDVATDRARVRRAGSRVG